MVAPDSQFEDSILDLKKRIGELEEYPSGSGVERELEGLRKQLRKASTETYRKLSAWQRTLVARNFDRPYSLDYVEWLMSDWVELHGDRSFRDDPALIAGLATFRGRSIAIVGHQKGRGTKERIRRNFGQANPEGHRKALRVMKLAGRFGLPIVTFIDTPGAYPGIGAEERGQAQAIAENLIEMATLPVPIVVLITGEGWSGGALALGVGDRVLMQQYAVHSVIAPEGCAAILWRSQDEKVKAAAQLKITAGDLKKLGIIDDIVPEPLGGAHADPQEAARHLGDHLDAVLRELERKRPDDLLSERYKRFRSIGIFEER